MRHRITIRHGDGSVFASFTADVEPLNGAPAAEAAAIPGGEKATEKQIKAMYAIVRKTEKLTDNDKIAEWLRKRFGVGRVSAIPLAAATAFIREHDGG